MNHWLLELRQVILDDQKICDFSREEDKIGEHCTRSSRRNAQQLTRFQRTGHRIITEKLYSIMQAIYTRHQETLNTWFTERQYKPSTSLLTAYDNLQQKHMKNQISTFRKSWSIYRLYPDQFCGYFLCFSMVTELFIFNKQRYVNEADYLERRCATTF